MITSIIPIRIVAVIALVVGPACAQAATKNARTTCLARAGVTEQQWQARQASYAQGAAFRSCMAEHGQNVIVHKRDGSVLK